MIKGGGSDRHRCKETMTVKCTCLYLRACKMVIISNASIFIRQGRIREQIYRAPFVISPHCVIYVAIILSLLLSCICTYIIMVSSELLTDDRS